MLLGTLLGIILLQGFCLTELKIMNLMDTKEWSKVEVY